MWSTNSMWGLGGLCNMIGIVLELSWHGWIGRSHSCLPLVCVWVHGHQGCLSVSSAYAAPWEVALRGKPWAWQRWWGHLRPLPPPQHTHFHAPTWVSQTSWPPHTLCSCFSYNAQHSVNTSHVMNTSFCEHPSYECGPHTSHVTQPWIPTTRTHTCTLMSKPSTCLLHAV